jgi:hypothetical protein
MNNRRLFLGEDCGKNHHYDKQEEEVSQDASGGGQEFSYPAEKGRKSSKDVFHGGCGAYKGNESASDSEPSMACEICWPLVPCRIFSCFFARKYPVSRYLSRLSSRLPGLGNSS